MILGGMEVEEWSEKDYWVERVERREESIA